MEEEKRQREAEIKRQEEEQKRLEEEERLKKEELQRLEEEAERAIKEREREEAMLRNEAEDAFAIIGDLDSALKAFQVYYIYHVHNYCMLLTVRPGFHTAWDSSTFQEASQAYS